MGPRARRGFRLDLDRVPDADRHAGHRRRLPAGRLREVEPGEYAGGIFWVVGLALVASWIVAVVFTPYIGSSSCRISPSTGPTTIPTRSTTPASIARFAA